MRRRDFVSLAGLAGVGSLLRPAVADASIAPPASPPTMVVGCQRAPTDPQRLDYFKRHGVEHICGFPPDGDNSASWSVESLSALRDQCEAHGVALDMIEFPTLSSASIDGLSRQHSANPQRAEGDGKGIMLGKEPDRQREIDQVCAIISNCARAGIPAAKYNLNLLGVLRTACLLYTSPSPRD